MTLKTALLCAAAFALPAAMAGAQLPTPDDPPPPPDTGLQAPETQPPADPTETPTQQPHVQHDPTQQTQAAPPATEAPAGPVTPATAADLRTGTQVRDQSGSLVGTVESADEGSAVINTGTARARLALSSFGRNNQGLVIAMTKAQIEAAVAGANPG